jgi:hypothetical protein
MVCRNSEYGGGAGMVRAGGDRKHSEYGGEYGSAVLEPRKRGEYGVAEERGKEYGGGGVERPSKWDHNRSPSANSAYRSDMCYCRVDKGEFFAVIKLVIESLSLLGYSPGALWATCRNPSFARLTRHKVRIKYVRKLASKCLINLVRHNGSHTQRINNLDILITFHTKGSPLKILKIFLLYYLLF